MNLLLVRDGIWRNNTKRCVLQYCVCNIELYPAKAALYLARFAFSAHLKKSSAPKCACAARVASAATWQQTAGCFQLLEQHWCSLSLARNCTGRGASLHRSRIYLSKSLSAWHQHTVVFVVTAHGSAAQTLTSTRSVWSFCTCVALASK
jgi:hypothetical protein